MKFVIYFLLLVPAWSATCTLPPGTYTLSTSAASWSCGHVPTSSDDARPATSGVNLTVDSAWSVNSFVVAGVSYPSLTMHSSNGGRVSVAFGQNFQCDYCSLSGLGDSTHDSIACSPVSGVTCQLTYSTIDTSGVVDFLVASSCDNNTNVIVRHNVFTNAAGNTDFQTWGYTGTPKTTGTREITFNVFNSRVNPSTGSLDGFIVEDNYFGQAYGPLGFADTTATYYNRNFVHTQVVGLSTSRNTNSSGTFRDHYIMTDWHVTAAASGGGGAHVFGTLGNSNDIQRVIFETSDRQDTDSSDLLIGESGTTVTWSKILSLPDAIGQSGGQLTSMAVTNSGKFTLDHSTWWAGSLGEAMVRWGEGGENSANKQALKNSIAWATSGGIGTWYLAKDLTPFTGGTLTQDVCAPGDCDYNNAVGYTATYTTCSGTCTNQGNGYIGKFSSTPGAHDIHVDPQFVDYQRNAVLWDSKYLGNSYSAWSSGATYNIGDLVTNTVSGSWWSLPVNYRRVVNSSCAGNAVPPGTLITTNNPSTWRASDGGTGCWELASLYRIRQGVAAATTITDSAIGCASGCTYTEAVFRWVSAGFSPTNVLLHNTGSDGTDIGAVSYTSSGGTNPTITPSSPPVVKQATTFQFSATCTGSCTWSLAAGSAGSINSSTGLYTAPSTVRHNNVIRGCPAFPNDHIYNQKISTLPTDTINSAAWITALGSDRLTYGVQTPSGENGFPLNIGNNSTPVFPMVFFYTPENNGSYMFLPSPYNQRENGAGVNISNLADLDRHQMTMNADTCHIQELYKPFNAGEGTAEGCPLCTAQGGLDTDLLGYRLGHGVDAAGTVMMPLSPRSSEIKAGVIKHAARIIIGANRTYCNHHIWPAQSEACNNTTPTNIVPYGACMRLKSSFNISGFSATAQVLLQELKDYCMIASDGGSGGQINITLDNDTALDLNLNKAIPEIGNANIFANQFEFVDVSSLKTSDSTSGQVKLSGAVNPSTFATVIATDSGGSSSLPVILQGVTVDVTSSTPPLGMPRFYIQAGTTKQFTATVRGSATTTVTWSRSPATGSVDATGLYTAPGSISLPTDVILTATSTVDGGASGSVTLTIMPSGTIRIDAGRIDTTAAGTVTTEGTWWNDTRQSGGGLCNYHPDNPWNLSDPNVETYYSRNGYGYGDHWYQYTVPNGWWKTTISLGDCRDTHDNSPIAPGIYVGDIESQGQTYLSNTDQITIACCNATAGTLTFTNQVTNGELWFVARATAVPGATVGKNLDLLNFKMEPVAAPTPSNNPTRLSGTITLKGRVDPIQ